MRKSITYLKKKTFKAEIIFLLILIVGFFCILPPSLNYGDHALGGLLFQETLINYRKAKNNYKGNFNEYFEDCLKAFHREKLQQQDVYSTYGLTPKGEVSSILNPTHYSVFILSRLSQLFLHFLSFGRLDVETCLMIFGLLIFILSYIYAYKLGKLLSDRRFGLILAVMATSNIYFNQLVRSMLFPFVTLYPLLFFASFYYLLLSHRIQNKFNWWPLLGLSISLSFCFLNGYPNTNVVLLELLIGVFIILAIHIKIFKTADYKFLSMYQYGFIVFTSIMLVFLISGLWSKLLGQHFFYGINNILHDRIWGLVLQGKSLSNLTITNEFTFRQIPKITRDVLRVLFISSKGHISPHEATFLQDLAFFNIVESVMFILGIIFTFRNILSKKIVNHLLLFLGVFFVFRIATNSINAGIIGRYTYDFYFITLFFAAYGLNQLIKLPILKNGSNINRIFYLILTISLFWNAFVFNNKFVWLFGEELNKSFGVYQLRKLYLSEMAKDNNLIIHDYYLLPHGYLYHINNISLLEYKTDYEIFAKLFVYSDTLCSREAFDSFMQTKSYKNVYFIFPTGPYRRGYEVHIEPNYNPPDVEKFAPFINLSEPYRIIKNRKGEPTFWIYKFSKSQKYE